MPAFTNTAFSTSAFSVDAFDFGSIIVDGGFNSLESTIIICGSMIETTVIQNAIINDVVIGDKNTLESESISGMQNISVNESALNQNDIGSNANQATVTNYENLKNESIPDVVKNGTINSKSITNEETENSSVNNKIVSGITKNTDTKK